MLELLIKQTSVLILGHISKIEKKTLYQDFLNCYSIVISIFNNLLGILILLFWVLFYEYFSTIGSIDNYNMGTLNASLVITTKPTRIAVLTNLSMGFGKYPLVRVCKMEMPKSITN